MITLEQFKQLRYGSTIVNDKTEQKFNVVTKPLTLKICPEKSSIQVVPRKLEDHNKYCYKSNDHLSFDRHTRTIYMTDLINYSIVQKFNKDK